MRSTYGLKEYVSGKPKKKKKIEKKVCRFCGKEFLPRTHVAAALRDICYSVECEERREDERREKQRKAQRERRRRKKKEE